MPGRCGGSPGAALVTTSFGMEGCALIDMAARHGVPLPVVYLDTMFLFPETYALRDRNSALPDLRFENRGTTLTPRRKPSGSGPSCGVATPTGAAPFGRSSRCGAPSPARGVDHRADAIPGGERTEIRELQ